MRAEEILNLIQEKTPFSLQSLNDLEALLEEYPYFAAAHLLFLLNLKQEKDVRLPAELRKAACYLNDRSKLFFLMEQDSFPPLSVASLEKKEQVSIESPFDLVDSFLSGKSGKEEPAEASELVTKDYISYFLSQTDGETATPAVPLKYQDTIDKFIESNEKAPIKIELKEEEESAPPPDLDSFDEDSFFSETLAKIYLRQKKYEKALEIIRQLYLRNPEKNRYFADQIRFLEKLIINATKNT